ncbi:MAG: transcriptional repressor LexA [Gammaproteobacteria bacterium]
MTTDFQSNLYQFIAAYLSENNYSPSFADITQGMGISPRSKSLITRSLRALEKEGKVILTKQGRHLLISLSSKHLTLLGRISAGAPIEAIAHQQAIDIKSLIEGNNRFALEVKGSSMMDEGILDGDLIICRRAHTAKEGEIVVALIDEHNATLKRISYKMKGMITLIPANSEFKPRAYQPDRIQIQGIYIGLIRVNS